jgi:hypothetical protein
LPLSWVGDSLKRGWMCAVLASLAACENGGLPTDSYTYPTAIIGIPLQSEEEAMVLQEAVSEFGKRHSLGHVYRPTDVPFFAEQGFGRNPDMTYYNPTPVSAVEGFLVRVSWWRPRCMLVELSELSGIWTPESLAAFGDLQKHLARVTRSRATLLVRPKRLQNWPEQNSEVDPERPTFPEELCVRMGLPDPRGQ